MSNTFKTKKGTELPFFMVQRKSKDKNTGQWIEMPAQPYLQVAHRLVWFREENPNWGIKTELKKWSEDMAIVEATISDEKGHILATAHKREDRAHFADYLEKAETSAIGRALALCGYGTQFSPEIEEQERLVDAPVERPKASGNFQPIGAVIKPPINPSKKASEKQLNMVMARMRDAKILDDASISSVLDGKTLEQLTMGDIDIILERIGSYKPTSKLIELNSKKEQTFDDLPF